MRKTNRRTSIHFWLLCLRTLRTWKVQFVSNPQKKPTLVHLKSRNQIQDFLGQENLTTLQCSMEPNILMGLQELQMEIATHWSMRIRSTISISLDLPDLDTIQVFYSYLTSLYLSSAGNIAANRLRFHNITLNFPPNRVAKHRNFYGFR